jgi:hypothetical protein
MKVRLTPRYSNATESASHPHKPGSCQPANRSASCRSRGDRTTQEAKTQPGSGSDLGIRPEAVERAKKLIADENYPPDPVLRKVAETFVGRLR